MYSKKIPFYLSQQELLNRSKPSLEQEGKLYEKFLPILAKKAIEGEWIETYTSDGFETKQQAKSGDFLVQNQTKAKEQYLLSAANFTTRYTFTKEVSNGFCEYMPSGKVIALEMTTQISTKLSLSLPTHFMAPWGTKMVLKPLDFLVSTPGLVKIYRIARKEFFETYRIVGLDPE